MRSFGSAIASSQLTGLSLNTNALSTEALEELLAGLSSPHGHPLHRLHLSGIPLGDAGASLLADFLGDPSRSRRLVHLTINQCGILLDGLRALSLAIEAGNFTLLRLEMSANGRFGPGDDDFNFGDDPLSVEAERLLGMMEQVDMMGPGAEYAVAGAAARSNKESSAAINPALRASKALDDERRRQERAQWERVRARCRRVPPSAFLRDVAIELEGDGSAVGAYGIWAARFGYLGSTNATRHLEYRTHHAIRRALVRNERLREEVRSVAKSIDIARIILLAHPADDDGSLHGSLPMLELPAELRLAIIRACTTYPDLVSETQWNRFFSHASERHNLRHASEWWTDAWNNEELPRHRPHIAGHPGANGWARTVLEEKIRLSRDTEAWHRRNHAEAFEHLLLEGIGIDGWHVMEDS